MRRHRDDDGSTLVELMVAMGIMGIVMVVFTGSVLQIYQASVRSESSSSASSQLRQAFQQLDKTIPYASWIATPGKVGTSWYVEFADATSTCGQLRVDNGGVLQILWWAAGSPPTAGSRGRTLASQLVVDDTVPPFVLQAAGAVASGASSAPDYQRLQIRLTVVVNRVATTLNSTFTAANTSRVTPAANTCSAGRPT